MATFDKLIQELEAKTDKFEQGYAVAERSVKAFGAAVEKAMTRLAADEAKAEAATKGVSEALERMSQVAARAAAVNTELGAAAQSAMDRVRSSTVGAMAAASASMSSTAGHAKMLEDALRQLGATADATMAKVRVAAPGIHYQSTSTGTGGGVVGAPGVRFPSMPASGGGGVAPPGLRFPTVMSDPGRGPAIGAPGLRWPIQEQQRIVGAPGLRWSNQEQPAASEPWRWNWGAAAGGGFFGRAIGGMPGGIGGALGGGIFGVPGAVGGALGGAGLDWLVVKPLSIAADLASTALHKLAEGVHFLVEKVFTLGIEFEKTRTEFSIMAGSPEKGLNLLGRIQELAVKSPYTTRELAPTGRMLLSMGVDPEDVPSVLSRIGDVAGGSRDRLNRLTLAYGQVVAAGRFRATELRQFTEAGVGVSDFARAAGVSPRRLREMMEGGEAGADIVGRTFNQITGPGGRFFNMSAGVNRTVGGQLNTLQESLEIAGQKAGVSAFARYDVSGRIDRLTASIEDIIKAAEKGGPALDEVVKMLDSVYEGVQKSIGSSNLTWESLTSTLADFGKNDLPGLITGIIELSGAFMELTAFSLRAAREIAAVVLAVPDTVSWAYHGFNSNTTGTYQKSREAFVNSTTALADAASRGGGFLLDRGQGVGDRVATAYALGGMRGAGLPEPEPGQMVNGRWLPHSTVTLAGGRTVSALSPEGRAALLSAGIPITYGYSAGGQQQLTRALQPFGVAGGQVPFLQNFFGAFGAVPRQGFVSPNIPIAPNAPRWSGEDQQLIDAMKKKFLERDPVTTLLNQFSLASRLQNPLVARNFNQLLFGEGFVPGINQQQGNFAREQAMTEFKKDMGIPVSPWEQFQKSMDQINTGIGADFTSRFAQGFGGGMAGTGLTTAMAAARAAAGAQGGPLQNALRMARVGAFDKLTQVRPWDSLPTAMQLGSSQAQETINRSMMMQQVGGGVQDRIDEALQEHKEMQQKQLKKLEDIEKAIKDRPGVEVVGG